MSPAGIQIDFESGNAQEFSQYFVYFILSGCGPKLGVQNGTLFSNKAA